MKFKKPENENYCATVAQIKSLFPLPKCDNIQGTIIFGNQVIIGKDTKVGDVGIFFPVETQLSIDYLKNNNLYRRPELNLNIDSKGYFEENGRIRAVKLRQNISAGLFMPLKSLEFINIDIEHQLEIGDSFDEIKGIKICNKYIIKRNQKLPGTQYQRKRIKESKCIENQFRFHKDTEQLGKNAYKIQPDDIISITYKVHGTSLVSSKVLCKKRLNIFESFLKFLKVNIVDKIYDNIYSSRKVIKNDNLNDGLFIKKSSNLHFYNEDIWGSANKKLQEFLLDGITIYAEIAGFLSTGSSIQGKYDYGCDVREFKIYIYRITFTNYNGDVFEFSCKQVQDWCKDRGLLAVPELYYGTAKDIVWNVGYITKDDSSFEENLLLTLKEKYLEKDCFMCKNKVPAEGIVVRKESNQFEAYKYKSFRFLELETKQLDNGESSIEDSQDQDDSDN